MGGRVEESELAEAVFNVLNKTVASKLYGVNATMVKVVFLLYCI